MYYVSRTRVYLQAHTHTRQLAPAQKYFGSCDSIFGRQMAIWWH